MVIKAPEKEKVFLIRLGRTVALNFPSLRDRDYFADTYGKERIEAGFTHETLDLDLILGMFWRLLVVEEKEQILKMVIKEEDESTGEIKTLSFTSPVERLKCIVSGAEEILHIMNAVLMSQVKSNPSVVETLKKKKMLADQLSAGTKDSISSPPNTDTQEISSSTSPQGKSQKSSNSSQTGKAATRSLSKKK